MFIKEDLIKWGDRMSTKVSWDVILFSLLFGVVSIGASIILAMYIGNYLIANLIVLGFWIIMILFLLSE